MTLRIITLFFLGASLLSACVAPPAANVSNAPTNSPAQVNSSPANTAAEVPRSEVVSVPVTMPLLDAMFSDETFASDLKSQVGLSDDQIDKLRSTARNNVLQLTDDDSDPASRSTTAAVKGAEKEITAIIGPDKTKQLREFIAQRWSGGDQEGLSSLKPNSVPTDTRIVVNSPAYRMDVFKDGQLVKSYKVGIGYPEFPLPIGLRHASEIIFNPTWTPPDEPWVKGDFAPGKTVKAGSKQNPLGPIKIPIGLPSLIHGGKDPSRLGTFASHGCVGLTTPQVQDFAIELASLSQTPLTAQDVKQYESQKTETKKVELGQKVPVELRYETIVATDGKLTIYRDVYERGTNTEENLRKVLESFGVDFATLSKEQQTAMLDGLKQMAVDASGSPVDEDDSNVNSKSKDSNPKGKITRNIKGKKEISFDLPQLKDKGYPAPIY